MLFLSFMPPKRYLSADSHIEHVYNIPMLATSSLPQACDTDFPIEFEELSLPAR
jgi:hypothetical protein